MHGFTSPFPSFQLVAAHCSNHDGYYRFRDAGKKLFLCSNSGYHYVDGGLQYMLGEDWREFFDVIIVGARKP